MKLIRILVASICLNMMEQYLEVKLKKARLNWLNHQYTDEPKEEQRKAELVNSLYSVHAEIVDDLERLKRGTL